jgi:hypothetical protein
MSPVRLLLSAMLVIVCSVSSWAQMPSGFPQIQGERMPADTALDRALKKSSLTFDGKPFHTVMEIGSAGKPYSGRLEFWWVNPTKYRSVITSPQFGQTKIVNGDRIEEKNEGDYYPRWLENFVFGVMDPVPVLKNFYGHGGAVAVGAQVTRSCLTRDDRPGGITDQITWGILCFSGSEPHVGSVLTMTYSMTFSDWKKFGNKQVAQTYTTDVLDYQEIVGRLTALEELKNPDESMFTVDHVTPADQRISTAFVSTLKEESLVEQVPAIQWPPVREGKTEGYMIVYARTDRTGQVRETAKHNSDQPGLEDFGMEQALRYKFKPLVVDGVAQQIEMPLVLHFSTTMGEPIPLLSPADMARQTISCKPASIPPGLLPTGTIVTIRVSVDEAGQVVNYGPAGRCPVACGKLAGPIISMKDCKFAPYVVNGKAQFYRGDVELVAP